MNKPLTIVSLLMMLAGAYLMAGFAHIFTVGNWPTYWPPMEMAAGILGPLATSQGGLLLGMIGFGFVFLMLGPILAVMGVGGLLMSLRR